MGAAPMAYALWTRHLRHNPKDPSWFNRDRFILSAGHGSMLLYALLHLTGYDLSLEDLKSFRQMHSKTPGHPENFMTPGVEMATGPLGQGFATGVGMAIAEKFLAATYGESVVDHHTYAICSDGDLMEGISSEAASLAGHLRLGKLIYLYDDNEITIDGSTALAFSEDVRARFEAFGWHVERVDGMDVAAVDAAIDRAKAEADRPSLIMAKTVIGYGSPNKAGSSKSHGSPLGAEEARLAKEALGIPLEPLFYVPEEALREMREAVERGIAWEAEWNERVKAFEAGSPERAAEFRLAVEGRLPEGWSQKLPSFPQKIATRNASGDVLNALANVLPTLIGGSADLAGSVMTMLKGQGDFQAATPAGRNLYFGVREHAMMAAVNGIWMHGGCQAYGGTFLIFSDYCRPALRLAALMQCPSLFLFSHDSIGLGEDGPTHQPIEHLMALRAIPNMNVMRPADGNETAACLKIALEMKSTPSCLVTTRQAVPQVSPGEIESHPALRGGYVVREAQGGTPSCVLVATGSEVSIAFSAADRLEAEGVPTRVVSLPSWFVFESQDVAYRRSVLPPAVPTVSVEAGTTLGWSRYAQAHVGLDRFGASGPGPELMVEFGFTPQHVAAVARELLRGA